MWMLAHELSDRSPCEARLLACDIAETVAYLGGQGCFDTISVARRYARGEATYEQLVAAATIADAIALAAEAAAEAVT